MSDYVVVQYGARRGYEVPKGLAEAGLLRFLQTDWYFTNSEYRLISKLGLRIAPTRILPKVLEGRAKRSLFWVLAMRVALLVPYRSSAHPYAIELAQYLFGLYLIIRSPKPPKYVYSMFLEGRSYLTHMKNRGARIIVDVNIALSAQEIVNEFHGSRVVNYFGSDGFLGKYGIDVASKIERHSDIFVVGSEFVKKDLLLRGQARKRQIRVVPYGVREVWRRGSEKQFKDLENGVFRILYVGSADPRKLGLMLIDIAEQLSSMNVERQYEFNIAGLYGNSVCFGKTVVNFHGKLKQLELKRLYQDAHLFVYPSLAEGSAGVVNEAIGMAIPQIVSDAAGSIVRNGNTGFILQTYNSLEWAQKIICLSNDLEKLKEFSQNSVELAESLKAESYIKRLLSELSLD